MSTQTSSSSSARPSGFTLFLVAASLVLASLVVVLALQNRTLKRALAAETERRARQENARFEPGEVLRPLRLLARDGSVEEVAFDGAGGRTLLLFYAETCNVCPQVFVSWEELAPQFTSEGVRVAAVQLDRKEAGATYGPPGIASFALADFSTVPVAKVASVPLTLLVDPTGVVEWVRYGTLTAPDMAAVVSFLGGK